MSLPNENINSLIFNASKGDEPAFEKIFRLYYPRLRKFALNILKNTSEAEDLVQDVFIQIWDQHGNLDSERHFDSYIFTLVKNRCLNTVKRKIVEDKYTMQQSYSVSEELYHISFDIAESFTSMEDKLTYELEKIIKNMPERCQIAFRLKWIDGKKIREIAELMGISTTMVDKHLAKGLQIARQNLSPEMFLFLLLSRK